MPRAELRLAWKTQAGHRHQVEGLDNEDAVFVTNQHPAFDAVLMVADGMGGHPRPREASEIAVRAAREYLFDDRQIRRTAEIPAALGGALQAANQAVRALGGERGGKAPGTTLSVAVVVDGVLHLAHVGDGSVFLMRERQVRPVAGGEEGRSGNRPAQYLGQSTPLEPEQRRFPVAEGDRLLLCTDGLTRYFREAGPEALERVLGRQRVDIQVIANQLTAHSRPGDYDDDTTVALAEVTALGRAAGRRTARGTVSAAGLAGLREPFAAADWGERKVGNPVRETTAGPRRPNQSLTLALLGVLAGLVLLAGGFGAGWIAARVRSLERVRSAVTPALPVRQPVVGEADLRHLPLGNVVLLDTLGGRVFLLSGRSAPPGEAAIELQAFKMGSAGRLAPAGPYRLDPARRELRDPEGRTYPVEINGAGSIRVLRGGTLAVNTRPAGAQVFVDGRYRGPAPQRLLLPGGRHQVRVAGRGWSSESEVDVPPDRSVTITLEPGKPAGAQ